MTTQEALSRIRAAQESARVRELTEALASLIADTQATYDTLKVAGRREVVVSIGQFQRLDAARRALAGEAAR